MYCYLNSDKIVNTLKLLARRIEERFPESGLSKVVQELLKTGEKTQERCCWVAKPLWHLRVLIWLLIALIAVSLVPLMGKLNFANHSLTFGEFIQILESGINDIVFLGIGIFFLLLWRQELKEKGCCLC